MCQAMGGFIVIYVIARCDDLRRGTTYRFVSGYGGLKIIYFIARCDDLKRGTTYRFVSGYGGLKINYFIARCDDLALFGQTVSAVGPLICF